MKSTENGIMSPTTEMFETKNNESTEKFKQLGKFVRQKNILKVLDTVAAVFGYTGLILQYFIVFAN